MEEKVNKKSISVIIPNYNGKHLLESYLPSVINALDFEKIDFEIIIIDDCSKDDSVSFLTINYPKIILLQNQINLGFSKTCNFGILKAQKELIFLLNSDVKLEVDYFSAQWKYFNDPKTYGVMGRIMNFDGKKIEDAARFPRFKGSKFKANAFYYSENDNEKVYTTYLSGANSLVDRQKLLLLNGFDEIYSPFYFEDFDLGLRAWQMGWFSYYEHQSVCYHRVSASTNNMNKSNFVKITYNRNSFILQAIHLKKWKKRIWYLQLFSTTLFDHLYKGEFWILKSINQFMKMKNQIEISKKNILDLQKKLNSEQTIESIIDIITESIKTKKINWL